MRFLRTYFTFHFVAIIASFFVFSGDVASAATGTPTASSTQYIQLENIPGQEQSTSKSFPEYVNAVYSMGLGLVGLSAMFMLIVGGFMYMTSAGNTSAAGSAKGVIKDALIGLGLGLAAWLILNTINPDLTSLNFSGLATGTSTPPPVTPSTSGDVYNNADAVAALDSANIDVTSTGKCNDQNNKTCTSLEGIPKDTINKVIALKQACNCNFDVTGGTEVGHDSHGSGLPVIDVSQDQKLGDYLNANKSNFSSLGISKVCSTSSWQRVSYNCGGYVEQKDHFHIAF